MGRENHPEINRDQYVKLPTLEEMAESKEIPQDLKERLAKIELLFRLKSAEDPPKGIDKTLSDEYIKRILEEVSIDVTDIDIEKADWAQELHSSFNSLVKDKVWEKYQVLSRNAGKKEELELFEWNNKINGEMDRLNKKWMQEIHDLAEEYLNKVIDKIREEETEKNK